MPNAKRIGEILSDCLFRDPELDASGKPTQPCVVAEALRMKFGFHAERLERHREEIRQQLLDLPKGFFSRTGGGGSFLDAVLTHTDAQWGEHANAEALLALALALGDAEYCIEDRAAWALLPRGYPYFVVKEWWPAATASGGTA